MRTRILIVGDDAKDPLSQAAQDYLKRAGRRIDAGIVPIQPQYRGKGSVDEQVRAAEADALLKASTGCTRIALDVGGLQLSSTQFSEKLENFLARGKPVAFLIGGATGLDPSVREQSDAILSLSPMTFAHRLALVVLAEQIYRAAEISRGGPYHK